MSSGICQNIFFDLQARLFGRIADASTENLFNLESQEIDFASADPGVSTEGGQRCINFGESGSGFTQRLKIGMREFVQGCPLHRSREQTLVSMLPVKVNQFLSQFSQLSDSRQTTIDIST